MQTVTFTDALSGATLSWPVYGSLDGVRAYFQTIPLTETSKPSVTDAETEAAKEGRLIEARLQGAGYMLPLSSAISPLVGDALNLRVAASLLERLIITRDKTTSKVETAEIWRRQADAILADIYAHRVGPPSVTTSNGAGVSNGTAAFPSQPLSDFIDSGQGDLL